MPERTYRRLTVTEAAAAIRGEVDTLILFHRHPDGDAVGSGFALRAILSTMGCRTYCLCEDEIPARLRFLVGDAQDSILAEDAAAFLPADLSPAQIIAVDTASPSQMGTLYARYGERVDLMIDHHGRGEMYADGWIEPEAAATGEMILALCRTLLEAGRLSVIPAEAARLMYAAISSDTGCFRFSNASPRAHRAAADLLEAGFDAADLNHRLFGIKSRELLAAEKVGYGRLRLFCDGKIGIVDMPIEVKRENGFTDEHLDTLVEVPRSLAGVEVAVAIRQPGEEPIFRVSMRSNGRTDVAAICASFGGGGHAKAAGCTIVCEGGTEAIVALVAEAVEAGL